MQNQEDLREELRALHAQSYAWALSCCRGHRLNAEDVLQTAYLRVLQGGASFDARSSFRTWLFGVIRNVAREDRRTQFFRALRSIFFFEDVSQDESPLQHRLKSEEAMRVRDALGQLSPHQQDLMHLIFYQEMTVREAAQVMGVSLGSASVHYDRAKKKMLELMQEQENQ